MHQDAVAAERVEHAEVRGQSRDVRLQETDPAGGFRTRPESLGGGCEHAGRRVDPGDAVPCGGQTERHLAIPAAEIQDAGRGPRQVGPEAASDEIVPQPTASGGVVVRVGAAYRPEVRSR